MRKIANFFITTYAYIYRNYIFAVRNLFTFFDILFWPFVGIISIGMMCNFLNLDRPTLSFLLTGAIISGVLQVTQLEVSYGILYEVWSKSIKQIFITPTNFCHIILGSWCVRIARGLIVYILLSLVSKYIFGFNSPELKIVIISLIGIFISSLIIGMMVNFVVVLYGQRVDIIAWSLSVVAMLICGIYYPVNILPKSIQVIAQLIPLTYFLEYFRYGLGFKQSFSYGLQKAFLLSFMYLLLLYIMITYSYKHAKKTGLILRLSE